MSTLNTAATDQHDVPAYRLALPATLAAIAGYVDACMFLAFAGFFVAQVTGSFVVAGSELVDTNNGLIFKVLAIPVFILAGMITTCVVRATDLRHAMAMTLSLECALLIGLVCTTVLGGSGDITYAPALFGLAAMGVQSATARLLLSNFGSTNVMTTNTTQLAIELVDSFRARRATPRLLQTGSIMLAFLVGVILGGLSYRTVGLPGLVLPCVVLVGIAAAMLRFSVSHRAKRRA